MQRLATTMICLSLLLSLQYGKITNYLYCEWQAKVISDLTILQRQQYGKITNYLYCEWQAKVVQSLPDCDCVQILEGVFDGNEDNLPGISQQQTKWGEYECISSHNGNMVFTSMPDNNQSFYLLHFPSPITEPAIRPPAGS